MPRFEYKILLCSLFLLMLGIFYCPNPAEASSITEDNIISLVNQARQDNNLPELKENPLLSQAALEKAQAILETGVFSHTINNQKFSAWIKAEGYEYARVGENLAIDFNTSEGALEGWLNSPEHKKNLVNPGFLETGVAVLNGKIGGSDTTLIVQIFGEPLSGNVLGGSVSGIEEKFNWVLRDAHINNPLSDNFIKYLLIAFFVYVFFFALSSGFGRVPFFVSLRNRVIGRNRQLKLPLRQAYK